MASYVPGTILANGRADDSEISRVRVSVEYIPRVRVGQAGSLMPWIGIRAGTPAPGHSSYSAPLILRHRTSCRRRGGDFASTDTIINPDFHIAQFVVDHCSVELLPGGVWARPSFLLKSTCVGRSPSCRAVFHSHAGEPVPARRYAQAQAVVSRLRDHAALSRFPAVSFP